jgi:integrase
MNYKDEFLKKGYSEKTAGIFTSWMNKLQKHYSSKNIDELTITEIRGYVDLLLTRQNLGSSSRIQAKKAFEFWYNSILNKGYNFSEIVVQRKYNRIVPEYFTQEEILDLIASSNTLKARMIISIAYGCGLDVGELCNIKRTDIDFENKRLKITYTAPKKKVRHAILSENLAEDIKLYLNDSKPKKWLFEGQIKKDKLSMRGAHWAFQKALEKSSIKKTIEFKSLKYSYIKHLEKNGYPLTSILEEVNLNSSTTYYALSIAGITEKQIDKSPLEFLHIKKENNGFETQHLISQINRISNPDEKEYLLEAVKCLEAGAYRAGIIFIWNYAIRNIHHKLLSHSLNSLNQAISRHVNNAKQIATEDDFAFIKESIVLRVTVDLGVFDKNQKKVLEDCLDIRNSCGHPGKYNPTETKAKAYIEDIINILN